MGSIAKKMSIASEIFARLANDFFDFFFEKSNKIINK